MSTPVLEVKFLSIGYETETGCLEAVRDVSFSVPAKTSLGLVGESGSGKSTLAMGIIRYLPPNGRILSGSIALSGTDLLTLGRSKMQNIWGTRIGMICQDPSSALNPALPLGRQMAETAVIHLGLSREQAREEVLRSLRTVAMPDPQAVMRRYPHQLSGGMLQRCVIAMALLTNPELLIMDEPTTALDVTTQAVVLDLVAELQKQFSSAILYITHNLAVVANICDSIAVMYAGEIMEIGGTGSICRRPHHPYTDKLLGCTPSFGLRQGRKALSHIPGYIPRLDELPEECVFAPRCHLTADICRHERPSLTSVGSRQATAPPAGDGETLSQGEGDQCHQKPLTPRLPPAKSSCRSAI